MEIGDRSRRKVGEVKDIVSPLEHTMSRYSPNLYVVVFRVKFSFVYPIYSLNVDNVKNMIKVSFDRGRESYSFNRTPDKSCWLNGSRDLESADVSFNLVRTIKELFQLS